jgi:hypothetical protein
MNESFFFVKNIARIEMNIRFVIQHVCFSSTTTHKSQSASSFSKTFIFSESRVSRLCTIKACSSRFRDFTTFPTSLYFFEKKMRNFFLQTKKKFLKKTALAAGYCFFVTSLCGVY